MKLFRNTTQYNQAGTITFRRSSSSIMMNFITKERRGTNLQNIEKDARHIYKPDEGKIFCQDDQSGAEALIVAYLCKNGNFRSLFLNNIKPHVFVALHLFAAIWDKKINEFSKDIRINIDEFLKSDISGLTSIAGWNDLDRLIKSSDNWPVSERYYYIAKQVCHCVSDDTEVLTPSGWKIISSAKYNNDKIACFDTNTRNIKFETPALWYQYKHKGLMYLLEQDELNQLVSEDHIIPYWANNKFYACKVQHLLNQSSLRVPNAGFYIGGDISLSDTDVQLLVAIQADGYITGKNNVRFRLKKERKIERLKSILNRTQYIFEERKADVTEIYLYNVSNLISRFCNNKQWGPWLLNLTKSNLELLISELKFWDGTYEEQSLYKREAYFSKYKQNADWIKTICHLVGKQGTLNKSNDVLQPLYTIGINNRQFSRVEKIYKIDYDGYIYCPSVTTHYFLIRRQGKISITGNSSNYGIKPPTFRLNTLEKSRGKIIISKQESERYLLFYHSLFPEIEEWHRDVVRQLELTRTLYNLFGFPRVFTGVINDSTIKEAYAFVPQSTVGCITAQAYVALQNFIESNKLDWDILADTHDSYLVQCPIGEEIECCNRMRAFMEQDLVSPRGEKFKMKSEASCGYNWAPYKKGKNEQGLK